MKKFIRSIVVLGVSAGFYSFTNMNPNVSKTVNAQTAPSSVIFNEINWAGSSASTADEWVELYNTTTYDIDLTGWTVGNLGDSVSPDIKLSTAICSNTTIPAGGYFLISNYSNASASSMLNTKPDCVTSKVNLDNAGEQLTLVSPLSASTIDTAGDGGAWFGGYSTGGNADYPNANASMIRVSTTSDGTLSSSWSTSKVVLNEKSTSSHSFVTPKLANSMVDMSGNATYEAEYLKIRNGTASGGAVTPTTSSGFVFYGPYTGNLTAGAAYTATFRMKIQNNTTSQDAARIDVSNSKGFGTLNTRFVKRNSFAATNTYEDFSVDFVVPRNGTIEFRMANAVTDLSVDKVTVTRKTSVSFTYEVENMYVGTGTVTNDGSGVSTGSASTNGQSFTFYGPYSKMVVPGNYAASFKVNAKFDPNDPAVTSLPWVYRFIGFVQVYDSTTGQRLNTQLLYSDNFTSVGQGVYTNITLPFSVTQAQEGDAIEYRFFFSSNSPGAVTFDNVSVTAQ